MEDGCGSNAQTGLIAVRDNTPVRSIATPSSGAVHQDSSSRSQRPESCRKATSARAAVKASHYPQRDRGSVVHVQGQRKKAGQALACIFHTPMETPTVRRVRARGLQTRTSAPVGRVPSRGVWGGEICGLEVDSPTGSGVYGCAGLDEILRQAHEAAVAHAFVKKTPVVLAETPPPYGTKPLPSL
jgi:hypothetical protein